MFFYDEGTKSLLKSNKPHFNTFVCFKLLVLPNHTNMKSFRPINVLLMFGLLVANACNKPNCTNTNPVFNTFKPDDFEYKSTLANVLSEANKAKLTYWFSEYKNIQGSEILYFEVQGENLCATLAMEVDDWSKLADLRQKKGVSYRGAEFVNLTYDILRDSSSVRFLFKGFDDIID